MKQIFDWLREQIDEKSVEVNNVAVVSLQNAIVSVNRAQLKWEQDCCEWVTGNFCAKIECLGKVKEVGSPHDFFYCPYCGRKISEVE